jgi:hypothetical protein
MLARNKARISAIGAEPKDSFLVDLCEKSITQMLALLANIHSQ